jgi:hypothetical protein
MLTLRHRAIFPALLSASLALLIGCASCSCSNDNEDVSSEQTKTQKETRPHVQRLKISAAVGNLSRQFADLNDVHLAAAEPLGISPIATPGDAWRIHRPLVLVETCEDFTIDTLTHSYPYLVPEAAQLLHEIGANFHSLLAQRQGGAYSIKVTSLLRTNESVSRLKRMNGNSVERSAHLYGTTFDISYVKFIHTNPNDMVLRTDGDLKNLLAEVLLALRDQGRCLVKYERHQGCFHITATGR